MTAIMISLAVFFAWILYMNLSEPFDERPYINKSEDDKTKYN